MSVRARRAPLELSACAWAAEQSAIYMEPVQLWGTCSPRLQPATVRSLLQLCATVTGSSSLSDLPSGSSLALSSSISAQPSTELSSALPALLLQASDP